MKFKQTKDVLKTIYEVRSYIVNGKVKQCRVNLPAVMHGRFVKIKFVAKNPTK